MAFVVVNAVIVEEEAKADFEERFAGAQARCPGSPGFEAFELLKPSPDGTSSTPAGRPRTTSRPG